MDAYGALAQAEYRLEPEKGCYSHIQISSYGKIITVWHNTDRVQFCFTKYWTSRSPFLTWFKLNPCMGKYTQHTQ